MATIKELIDRATKMASDSRYSYGKTPNNGTGNTEDPTKFDCCTSISYLIYKTLGWNWAGQTHKASNGYGHFWSHTSDKGYDLWLTEVLGCEKIEYKRSSVKTGDIIITTDNWNGGTGLGHVVLAMSNNLNSLFDANDAFKTNIGLRDYINYGYQYIYRLPWDTGYEEEKKDGDDMTYQETWMVDAFKNEHTLKKGCNDAAAVKFLQEYLAWFGYYSGDVDGDFGNMTHDAVVKFQKAKNLTADGIVGYYTWSEIQKG